MHDFLVFDVSALVKASLGTSEKFSFQGQLNFDDLVFLEPAAAEVEIMRIEKGLNVIVKKFSVVVEAKCVRTLKDFPLTISFAAEECQFYLENQHQNDDLNDFFLINRKNNTIDLADFIRQQIILHFPENPVCSTGLEDLFTDQKDKERVKRFSQDGPAFSSEEQMEEGNNRPLAKLKDLLQ